MSYIPSNIHMNNSTPVRIDNSAGFRSLEFGTVVSIDPTSLTVTLRLDNFTDLTSVPVLFSKYSAKGIAVDTEELRYISKSTGKIYLPEVGSRVIVGFIRGKISKPIVLGCFKDPFLVGDNPNNTSQDELDIHQSQYFKKVDTNGNYEEYFPDGTTLSVSDTVVSNTDTLSEESSIDTTLVKSSKTFRIKHNTGTCIKITASGGIEIDTTASGGKVSIKSDTISIEDTAGTVEVIKVLYDTIVGLEQALVNTLAGPMPLLNATTTFTPLKLKLESILST